ncbi:MAG: hypothetical protein AMXMBFR33_55940 [Candidatus Xenobia bacterium]
MTQALHSGLQQPSRPVGPEGGVRSFGPGRRQEAPPARDSTHFSAEPDEPVDAQARAHLAGLKANFGFEELINPSAPVEKDCAEILAALGEPVPGDIDMTTNVTAWSVGPGKLAGVVTGGLVMDGQIPAMGTLNSNIVVAEAGYRGPLPPFVKRHVDLARAAAARVGLRL